MRATLWQVLGASLLTVAGCTGGGDSEPSSSDRSAQHPGASSYEETAPDGTLVESFEDETAPSEEDAEALAGALAGCSTSSCSCHGPAGGCSVSCKACWEAWCHCDEGGFACDCTREAGPVYAEAPSVPSGPECVPL